MGVIDSTHRKTAPVFAVRARMTKIKAHTYTAHLNKNIDEHVHDASMQDYGRDEAPVFSRCDEDRHLASHLDERLRRHS